MAALSIADVPSNVTVGVDTHKHSHIARAKDGLGRHLGQLEIDTDPRGYAGLLAWAQGFGPVVTFGIEGTSSYGAGLTRFLRAQGQAVIEVLRPVRRDRRFGSKSDPIDADAAAGAVLSGKATAVPKAGDAGVEMVRALKIAKQTAIKARTQEVNAVKGLIVMAPDPIRDQLRNLKTPARSEPAALTGWTERATRPLPSSYPCARCVADTPPWTRRSAHSRKSSTPSPSGSSHSCANYSASARMWPRPWCWRPGTVETVFAPRHPSQCCAVHRRFRPRPAWCSVTGSIAAAIVKPTLRYTRSSSSGCDMTRQQRPISRSARKMANPRRRSSAA